MLALVPFLAELARAARHRALERFQRQVHVALRKGGTEGRKENENINVSDSPR
jgi:hypothetical protein